ncbi:hypothetical protein JW935_14410 [candidate division KSB1 bacterium]|nr:hypothetical protein [candidate division KSB1 bacterium]
MKHIAFIFIVVLAVASMAVAETPSQKKFDKAINNYIIALKSKNPGVQSSAAFQIAKMKSQFPQVDLSRVEKSLAQVAKRNENKVIRLQAELTLTYVKDADLVYRVRVNDTENPVYFYNDLNQTIFAVMLEK